MDPPDARSHDGPAIRLTKGEGQLYLRKNSTEYGRQMEEQCLVFLPLCQISPTIFNDT